jgi:hypothetical protein
MSGTEPPFGSSFSAPSGPEGRGSSEFNPQELLQQQEKAIEDHPDEAMPPGVAAAFLRPDKAPQVSAFPTGEKLLGRPLVSEDCLPSRGIPYGSALPDGVFYISSMTVADEKALALPSTNSADRANALILACCDLGSILPDELVGGDRFYIMFRLRILAYGNQHEIPFKCESCNAAEHRTIDLEKDLNILCLDGDWVEPFDIKLPVQQDTLSLRLLRGRDEKPSPRRKQSGGPVESPLDAVIEGLASTITAINGERFSKTHLKKYVEALAIRDRNAISKKVAAESPGIDTDFVLSCRACGYENDMELRLTAKFFRPEG